MLIGLGVAAVIGASLGIQAEAYTDGYCAALGGTVLNPETCAVDGLVVPVVTP